MSLLFNDRTDLGVRLNLRRGREVTTHLEARGLKAEDLDAFQKIFLHLLTIKHGAFDCF